MYKLKARLRKSYIDFVEVGPKSIFGRFFYGFLYLLSLVYAFFVLLRNFFYDFGVIKAYRSDLSFVVGIGNISWAGTGKTSLSLLLYHQFSSKLATAILRRGYGQDENDLITRAGGVVFSSPDRRAMVKRLEKKYQLFILDDAFQYRRLKKDIEIVMIGAREFSKKIRLIPVSFFREPFSSLRRADFIIVNYKERVDRQRVQKILSGVLSGTKLYFADYQVLGLSDLKGSSYSLESLAKEKIAAFAAIGYPQGFFDLLENLGFKVSEKIIYPDHSSLSVKEYLSLESKLLALGIKTLIITEKDRYHLPVGEKKIDIFILNVKLKIECQDQLISQIEEKIREKYNKF